MDKEAFTTKINKVGVVFDHDGTVVDTRGLNPVVFPGIMKLLTELNDRGVDLYLWSLRPRASLTRIMKEVGIFHYFRDLRGSDDGNYPKPHPEGLNELLEGYDLKKVCHIGDGSGDYAGASSLKIPFIAACWNDPSYDKQWEELKAMHPPMRVVRDPSEVINSLIELGVLENISKE